MADTVHLSFPILKYDQTPDGDIRVYGKVTDGTVDSDHQIVDPKWSGKALTEWLETGGNMRVQHSPFLYPAGKGLSLDINKTGDGGHYLTALVVEDTAKNLVKKGVLRDFSVGILDPRIVHDSHVAPGGRICGGTIGEVSLVDRGSNKGTTFQIVKGYGSSAKAVGKTVSITPMARMAIKGKGKKKITDSSGRDVSDLPEEDFAGPDHSFPIVNRGDVGDAAGLAHHADDPEQVRANIKRIARRKFGMKDEDMPPSLQDKKAEKADKDGHGPDCDCDKCMKDFHPEATKAAGDKKKCELCKGTGKIREGHVTCPKCKGDGFATADDKQDYANRAADPHVTKGDAGEDYVGDADTDDSEADYDADDDDKDDDSGKDDDDKDDDDSKSSKADKAFRKLIRKQRKLLKQEAQRGNNGGDTPAGVRGKKDSDAEESGYATAEDKTMIPAGKHREPDGPQAEGVEHDADMKSSHEPGDETGVPGSDWKVTKSAPSFAMRRFHDAICPAFRWKTVRKSYGLPRDVGAAVPVRELESIAMDAIAGGRLAEAEYFTDILKTVASLQSLGPDLLLDARKAFPEMFPDTHVSQQQNVRPSEFSRGYLSAGHPSLSAGSESGHPSLPAARVHEVSAQDFRRGYLSAGRASESPGASAQATASTAAFGAALSSLEQMHQRVSMLWPDMCPVSLTYHDYTTGEGQTGIRPGHAPSLPSAPGEAATKKAEAKLRKQLAKAETLNKRLKAENDMLGALPDPEHAPYRGLPVLDGPVDRESFVGKAIGGTEEPDENAEFLEFINGLAAGGDPKVRLAATKAIRSILTT